MPASRSPFPRFLQRRVLNALADTPVTFLVGARQTGKSTLCRAIAGGPHPARYLSFDDATTLASARTDPHGFVESLEGPVVLDEAQRVPELFPALKVAVDERRRPGSFLLTGSANVLALPRLSESLAGRMEVLTLWPLSQGEIERTEEGFVDALFARAAPALSGSGETRSGLLRRVLRGGFPEVVERSEEERRQAWLSSYVLTILQRDVRDLAGIVGLTEMSRLLGVIAARTGALLNASDLSRTTGIPLTTVKRYLALLEATFLVRSVPAWSANLRKRLMKSPRLFLSDTALAASLSGSTAERLSREPGATGPLVENFVAVELLKQSAWSRTRPELFHYRTLAGDEVDFVMESPDGRLVGIEVKASSGVGSGDFSGLRKMAENVGGRFHRGAVLYAGRQSLTFGSGLLALPISSLWRASVSPGAPGQRARRRTSG